MRTARFSALAATLLLAALLLLATSASAGAGVSEEGDPDCDKATGWEALENPEPEEGCVWDVFTALYEWGEVKMAGASPTSRVTPPPNRLRSRLRFPGLPGSPAAVLVLDRLTLAHPSAAHRGDDAVAERPQGAGAGPRSQPRASPR